MNHAGDTSNQADRWQPDILGDGFESLRLPLGNDPDGEGEIAATLVRFTPDADNRDPSKPAILWVHGMTDYFFQSATAKRFAEQGYPFYALDLRKCGRSREEGQTWHYVSDLKMYHLELNKAFDVIAQKHDTVIPLAHSTAGCIVPHWMDELRRDSPERHAKFSGLILNSPWLDIQGYHPTLLKVAKPAVRLLARFAPMAPFPSGGLQTYGESLHKTKYGDNDYDLAMKPLGGHRKYLSWLISIFANQEEIHAGQINVGTPVLTLCSTESILEKPFSDNSLRTDVILDVKHMLKWSPLLSDNVVIRPLQDAIHEVYLSREPVRSKAFDITFDWLKSL